MLMLLISGVDVRCSYYYRYRYLFLIVALSVITVDTLIVMVTFVNIAIVFVTGIEIILLDDAYVKLCSQS